MNAATPRSDLGEIVDDPTLLVALCEQLCPYMNGARMRRLVAAVDEIGLRRDGSGLAQADREWIAGGLGAARQRKEFWASLLGLQKSRGIEVVTVAQPGYPANLRMVHDGPPLLFVRSADPVFDRRAVAVVGNRRASPEGLRLARRLATDLVGHGYTVVSGLARGIDTAAHSAVLTEGGRTVAVLGTHVDSVYPPENGEMAARIAETGALVSQFLPNQRTGPWAFPARNVTCSGLALATLVVETAERSGARLQAEAAIAHGKRVFLTEHLARAQNWASAMADEWGTVVVVSDAAQIVETLEADLSVNADAVF